MRYEGAEPTEKTATLTKLPSIHAKLDGRKVRVFLARGGTVSGIVTASGTAGVLLLALEPVARTVFYPWPSVVEMEMLA